MKGRRVMSMRTKNVNYATDLDGLIETYNLKAKSETKAAIDAAEGGGCVTKQQDDQLTANAQNIGKMLANAKSLIAMLSKAGYKGPQLEAAKNCLNRLRLQQYKALAADERLNENEGFIKKDSKQALNVEKKEPVNKQYIKLELTNFQKHSLLQGLDFDFNKRLKKKKMDLNKQKDKTMMFLKERAQRQI
jgi:hypothetical protein